jgi:hypothetical protein
MPLLVPRMVLEPPPRYVAFVAAHLEELRADAEKVVGDQRGADELYPEVLTDVAMRWTWLEMLDRLSGRLGGRRPGAAGGAPRSQAHGGRSPSRAGAADDYLRRSFARRVGRWHADRFQAEDPWADTSPVQFQVWHADALAPPLPKRTSAATRLAPLVRPAARGELRPVAEAALAWWHGYEARRRRRWIILLVVALILIALLTRFAVNPAAADVALAYR